MYDYASKAIIVIFFLRSSESMLRISLSLGLLLGEQDYQFLDGL